MKIVALLPVLTLSACASWTPADSYREGAALGLLAVDYAQTMHIADNPQTFYERNPILGEHPSKGEVTAYFAGAAAAHLAIAALLPPKWREVWQYATITLEAGVVAHNVGIGIGTDF